MTRVKNLLTGQIRVYDLPPAEAVVAAYEQGRGNYNTWQYPTPAEAAVRYGPSGRTVFRGDWGALLDETEASAV